MQPKLVELASMIRHQLPVLMSFVLLRLLGVFATHSLLYAMTPKRVRAYVDLGSRCAARMRSVAMAVGCGCIALQTFYDPPGSICAEFDVVKTQGMCAMLSLAVLMTSNGVLSSAVALGALEAVANSSASALVLSSSAAVIANSKDGSVLFVYALFWVATAHTGLCHSETSLERTHGSIITVLAIVFNAMFIVTKMLCQRCLRVVASVFRSSVWVVRLCKRTD